MTPGCDAWSGDSFLRVYYHPDYQRYYIHNSYSFAAGIDPLYGDNNRKEIGYDPVEFTEVLLQYLHKICDATASLN